jgi:hypothetical protein
MPDHATTRLCDWRTIQQPLTQSRKLQASLVPVSYLQMVPRQDPLRLTSGTCIVFLRLCYPCHELLMTDSHDHLPIHVCMARS